MNSLRSLGSVFVAVVLTACGSSSDGGAPVTPGADGSLGGDDASGGGDSGAPTGDGSPSTGDDGEVDATTPASDGSVPGSDAGPGSDASLDAAVPGDGGAAQCSSVSDCTLVSNYCGGCACDALGKGRSLPHCDAGLTSCLTDPCNGKTAVCNASGRCAVQ